MSAERAFLDTNVLVYAFDRSDAAKQRRAAELVQQHLEDGTGVISTQVLSEFFVTVTRKVAVPFTVRRALEVARDLNSFHVVEISAAMTLEAMDRVESAKLSYWDALILTAAEHAGCRHILTEDLHHGAVLDGVTIQNPFR